MPIAYYITHPQVQVDANVPVPEWGLSDIGKARAVAMLDQPWIGSIRRIVSSAERKAIETAEILATRLRLAVEVRERMHENDRSATGFLPPPEFEAVADQFFANPNDSIRGWERAIDAQRRIVSEVDAVLGNDDPGDTAFVGHGGVGTLLLLSLTGRAISREADQPAGGGNYFAYDIGAHSLIHGWRPIDRASPRLDD
ncbi:MULTISPECIES: histidine phosphatase family protein [unclassified Mesorhizobium]|uniref:histidine phosphatase family protein n=1 Tax=unclassified Mesorhizobium TaxID=325217 RepID=UPI000FCA040E|nr:MULTISPECIES: histidine phosphatase family protein [unclassified Mesorhizobium]RUW27050.1 histidine phosphatase family protein [Mesorhizobium sp. M4B.F.Ca.ET.013.02.1.1]RVD31019.1 histidine phosphatase family protein [Mesorhizobium sp. M4B.F.Ca.ET.017.02.2.1]RVD42526.1 histidine phosphatase family protein [Mesorhizobium sp. M4B.F.Ca.ET.019.03.1.1]RWC97197.1 MAG: histidine phosphatase family protein [Mesorhizobium sp.]RWF67070.1 MAG: histidine phosphatase family protein [Mesorhizobium sp.]